MTIQLDGERTASTPVLKRREIGERYIGVVVNREQRGRLKDGAPLMKDNGKQAQELVATLLTIKSTMIAGLGSVEQVAQPGDIVRLISAGGAFAQWIEALRQMPRALQVGDVVELHTTHAELYEGNSSGKKIGEFKTQDHIDAHRQKHFRNPAGGGTIGMRGTIVIRPPKADEATWVDKAEAAHMAAKTPTVLAHDSSEDPF